MATNLPTSTIVQPADAGDSSLAQTLTGMNGANNNPGIGIAASAVVNPKVTDWSQVAREPDAQPLGWGGDSVETGQETADIPQLTITDYVGADFNDTAIFALADTIASAKDAVYDSVSGAILKSDLDVATAAGDWLWGATPVV